MNMPVQVHRRCGLARRVPPARRRGGLTLMEVVVSSVLVSTLLLVSLTASATLLRNQVRQGEAAASASPVAQLLDEVSAMAYSDPQTEDSFGVEADETGGDRTTFDDVDDYDGYQESPPLSRDGKELIGYRGWSRSVSVTPCDPVSDGIQLVQERSAPLRLVTVTATAPSGVTFRDSILVSAVPHDTPEATTVDRFRRIRYSFGGDRQIDIAVPLRNLPETVSK